MKHPGTKRALLQWPTVPLQMFCLSVVLESPRNTILSQPRLSFLEETEVSYQTSWENTKSRKKWRITAKHGWEETHSAVWLPLTPCHTHSAAFYVHPWTPTLHIVTKYQSNTQIPRNQSNYNIKAHPCDRPPQSRKGTLSSSSTGDWTWGFLCAREAFCHWSISLAFSVCVLAQACQ